MSPKDALKGELEADLSSTLMAHTASMKAHANLVAERLHKQGWDDACFKYKVGPFAENPTDGNQGTDAEVPTLPGAPFKSKRWADLPILQGTQFLNEGETLQDVRIDAKGGNGINLAQGAHNVSIRRVFIYNTVCGICGLGQAQDNLTIEDVRIEGGPRDANGKAQGIFLNACDDVRIARTAFFRIGKKGVRRSIVNQGIYLKDCTNVHVYQVHGENVSHALLKFSSSGEARGLIAEHLTAYACGMIANYSVSEFKDVPEGIVTDSHIKNVAGERFGGEYYFGDDQAFVLWLPGGGSDCTVNGATCGPTWVPDGVPKDRGIVDAAGKQKVTNVHDKGWRNPKAESLWGSLAEYQDLSERLQTYIDWTDMWPKGAEVLQ